MQLSYHIVIIIKYRKITRNISKRIGEVTRDLFRQRVVEMLEVSLHAEPYPHLFKYISEI